MIRVLIDWNISSSFREKFPILKLMACKIIYTFCVGEEGGGNSKRFYCILLYIKQNKLFQSGFILYCFKSNRINYFFHLKYWKRSKVNEVLATITSWIYYIITYMIYILLELTVAQKLYFRLSMNCDELYISSTTRWSWWGKNNILIFPFLHHLEKEKIRKTEHKEHKQQLFLFLDYNKGGRKTGEGWSFSYSVRNILRLWMGKIGRGRSYEWSWCVS